MAFGIAGSRAGSLSINTGTMTKSSHAGHAARMGVECGLKAELGWTAADDVFGAGGFFDTFWPGNARPELLVEGFGEPWRMLDPGVGFKKYPSDGAVIRRAPRSGCASFTSAWIPYWGGLRPSGCSEP